MAKDLEIDGFKLFRGYLDREAQAAMLADIRAVAEAAPFFAPLTPWGKPMSVRMTSAGKYGWFTDRKGYRYEPSHPSGVPWPPIPERVLAVWCAVSGWDAAPDCCLVNHYREKSRMGLHQDKDERDFTAPVVSISLGDPAVFRFGGTTRGGPTRSMTLESGDVMVMGGPARLAFHGVDRIRFGGSTLLEGGGRINLTLRVVD